MPDNSVLGAALRFAAQDNHRVDLKKVITEFQKGLPDENGNTVSGTPNKTHVQNAIPSLHSIKSEDWREWVDGANGTNQKIILKLLQQLSLLNYGNPYGDPSNGGEVTEKT